MSAATELEKLIVRIVGDATGYDKTLDNVEKKSVQVFEKVSAVGKKMSLAITTPLVTAGTLAVREFAKFDDAMTKSLAIMSGVSGNMKKEMADVARSISRNSTTSADKVAESYYFLASAGMDATQAMKALPVVERFAVAGAFDMAQATEMLADAQSALGLAVKDPTQRMLQMTRVSDVLVEAANRSNASQAQFAKALTTKSAVAMRGVNKEIEEGVAVLAVYADQGIKGEMAGEKFTIMLREMVNASQGKKKPVWEQMGLKVFDEATGKMRHLADIIGDLEKKQQGMTDKQKLAMMSMLGFRSESVAAITPLIGLSAKIREYETGLTSAGGATEKVANEQMKSFANQLAVLKNRVMDAAITVGEILAPYVGMLAQKIAELAEWFQTLDPYWQRVAIYAAAIAAALGPVLYLIGAIAPGVMAVVRGVSFLWTMFKGMFSLVIPALGIVKAGILALLSPWGLVAGAIAGIIALLIGPEGFGAAWEWVKEVAGTFFENMMGWIANFSYNFGELTRWLGENWFNIIKDMGQILWLFLKAMPTNFMASLKLVLRLFVAFCAWVGLLFQKLFSSDFMKSVWDGIKKATAAFVDWIKNLGKMFWAWIVSVKDWFWSIFSKAKDKGGFEAAVDQVSAQAQQAQQEGLGQTLLADAAAGGSEMNFLKTASDIIKDDKNGFVNPLADFESSIQAGPNFKYDRAAKDEKKTAGAVAEGEKAVLLPIEPAPTGGVPDPADPTKKKKKESSADKDLAAVTRFSEGAFSTITKAAMMGDQISAMATDTVAGAQQGVAGAKATTGPSVSQNIAGVRQDTPEKTSAEALVQLLAEAKYQTKLQTEMRDALQNQEAAAIELEG